MATAAVTQFPCQFVSGDAVRVTIADSRYPSTLWTLKVWFQSATAVTGFDAPAGTDGAYDLFITPTQSAGIHSGAYTVRYVFTEIAAPNDRKTGCEFTVQVYANPAVAEAKSQARLTLEAMEAMYLTLSGSVTTSVNFNGQSFTNSNAPDFFKLLQYQRAIVAAEDAARLGHRKIARIVHPL